jgi:thioredoxin reductase (NADPH)
MTRENDIYDFIILGGGPAGLTAGMYAMRAVLKTILVEKGTPGGQLAITKGVENYPGIEDINGLELADKLLNHARSYGLEVLMDEAVAVETGPDLHTVVLASGRRLKGVAVLIATGGTPRKLGIPGEVEYVGRGVSYCAKCDGFFFKDRVVTVIGGGDTAVEEALYLAKLASKVYLIHRRDEFRAGKLLQKRLMDSSIELVLDSAPTRICADDEEEGVCCVHVRNVKTGEEKEIKTDGVFIFIGINPNNTLVPPGVALDASGYAIADEKCETNVPGIYIAGDLRQKFAKQIVVAAAEGSIAALAAAGYIDEKKDAMKREPALSKA